MKLIRIRHRGDPGMFFSEFGWSLNAEGARKFNSPLEAITFIIQRDVGNAELVVSTHENVEAAIAV